MGSIEYIFLKLIYFNYLEVNHFTILWWYLPYINMNQPWVYMCPASRTPLPPPSPSHPIPLGCPSIPALSVLLHASNLDWSSISHMEIYIFRYCSLKSFPLPSPTESKSLFFICVSFAISHIGSSLPYICVNILYWCFSF